MQNVSSAFMEMLENDQRNYIEHVKFTLANGTVLNLSNEHLWKDGFTVEDSIYPDSTFAIGGAIINKAKVVLNNIYGDFDSYDFMNAKMEMSVGLLIEGTEEIVNKGIYTVVDFPNYNGSIITIEGLDNMHKFDIEYGDTTRGSRLGYPATLDAIVRDACSKCDVLLDNSSLQFPHNDYVVQNRPEDDSTTFREVISWAAQIAGCYCRINVNGRLELNTIEVSDYLNTTNGMTMIVSSRLDDVNTTTTGVSWFTFDGVTADPIYVNSNSKFAFGGSAPSTSYSSPSDLNICRADGQLLRLYRQAGSIDSIDFLKYRYEGFTRYQAQYQTNEYALKYELFLLSTGEMFLNIIQLPTNQAYMGSTSIIAAGGTTTFTPEVGGYMLSLDSDTGKWEQKKSVFPAFQHVIKSVYSKSIAMDDTVITGVNVRVRSDNDSGNVDVDYFQGRTGYVVSIEGNEFITTDTGAQIAQWLGAAFIGMRFRKLSLAHTSDPTIEAGDNAVYMDSKGNSYAFIVSRSQFKSFGNAQNTVCGSEIPIRNSAARFSEETKNYVDIRRRLGDEKTDRQQAVEDLANQLNTQNQMFIDSEYTSGTLSAIIIHNKPLVAESDIIWKITTNAFGVSTDGGQTYNLGATADGTLITQIISTVGLNASWINTGTLKVGGTTKTTDGVIEVYNSSGTRVGRWEKTGFYQGNIASSLASPNTKIDNDGAITTKSLTANDYVYVDGNNSSLIKIPVYYSSSSNYGFTKIDKYGISGEFNFTNSSYRKAYYNIGGYKLGTNSSGANYPEPLYGIEFTYNNSISVGKGKFHTLLRFPQSEDETTFSSRYNNKSTEIRPGGIFIYSVSGESTVSKSAIIGLRLESSGCSAWFGAGSTECDVSIRGDLSCTGTKQRLVTTKDYGKRYLYCYETPSPLFGDVGEGTIGEDGKCYVQIDSIFAETVTLNQYQVFLQKYGNGDCWVSERKGSFFVVEGTAGLKFGWEIKAKQSDYDQRRLEKEMDDVTKPSSTEDEYDYASELENHISEIQKEREVTPE